MGRLERITTGLELSASREVFCVVDGPDFSLSSAEFCSNLIKLLLSAALIRSFLVISRLSHLASSLFCVTAMVMFLHDSKFV